MLKNTCKLLTAEVKKIDEALNCTRSFGARKKIGENSIIELLQISSYYSIVLNKLEENPDEEMSEEDIEELEKMSCRSNQILKEVLNK